MNEQLLGLAEVTADAINAADMAIGKIIQDANHVLAPASLMILVGSSARKLTSVYEEGKQHFSPQEVEIIELGIDIYINATSANPDVEALTDYAERMDVFDKA